MHDRVLLVCLGDTHTAGRSGSGSESRPGRPATVRTLELDHICIGGLEALNAIVYDVYNVARQRPDSSL